MPTATITILEVVFTISPKIFLRKISFSKITMSKTGLKMLCHVALTCTIYCITDMICTVGCQETEVVRFLGL